MSILGKPRDVADARAMLVRLAGRRHEVTTAYRIWHGRLGAGGDARVIDRAVTTQVAFRLIQPAEIDAYAGSGEWQGKAGGYAVQGIAAVFTTELRGSHSNVIGLPLAEVRRRSARRRRARRLPARGVRRLGRSRSNVSRADELAARLGDVRARIAAAATAAGRAPGDITLIAVSKKMPPDDVAAAIAAGQLDFGENYAQELRDKRAAIDAAAPPADGPMRAGTSSVRCRPTRSSTSRARSRCCTPSTRSNCSTRSRAARPPVRRRTAWCRSTSRAKRTSTASRPPSCPRCSTTSVRARRCAASD